MFLVLLPMIGCTPNSSGPPAVHIATGETQLEALEDALPLHHGDQGGYHVWHGVKACNLSSPYDLHFIITTVASEAVISETLRVALPMRTVDDCDVRFGIQGILDTRELGIEPPDLVGQPLRIDLWVTDSRGVEATDSQIVLPTFSAPMEEPAP